MQGDITRSAALVLFPPHGSRVWVHYGITAPAQPCRTGPALCSVMPLFTKTSPAHWPQESRVVSCRSCVRTYLTYISETGKTEKLEVRDVLHYPLPP